MPLMGIEVSGAPDTVAAASLAGVSVDELERRDAAQRPIGRWTAYGNGAAVGVATAFVRPDDRRFLVHRLTSDAAYAPLLERAVGDLRREIHVTIDRRRVDRVAQAENLGFATEFESTSFAVPFAAALANARRLLRPTRFELRRADEVAADALFELDSVLRGDVPGNDGWRGNRAWYDDEFTSPEYEPAGYLVAVDEPTEALVGLVRFWRNDDGPALGMIGVRREHRGGHVAAALLEAGLRAAATWESPTFSTHTAHGSLQQRLRRLGATETGGFVRLRWTPSVNRALSST
jgi:GNAT superfamily N-acetyltransferase